MKLAASALALGLVVGASHTVRADEADLKQNIVDLTQQRQDKQRIDAHGSSSRELEQVSGWLDKAKKLVEDDEDKVRRLLGRVRLQFALIDQLIDLSKLRARADTARQALAKAQAATKAVSDKLAERQAHLKALRKMK